jgi:hypothetical protein
MTNIVKKVEIKVTENKTEQSERKSKVVYYCYKPDDFFLEDQTQAIFFETMDLENSRQYILKYANVLIEEMAQNYKLASTSQTLYYCTNNNIMKNHMIIAWLVGLAINIICLVTYRLSSYEGVGGRAERKLFGEGWMYGVNIASFVLCAYCFVIFLIWIVFKLPSLIRLGFKKFLVERPTIEAYKDIPFLSKLEVVILNTLLNNKPAVNMFLHSVFGILAPFVDPYFHSLHLLLYVNISRSANFILKASTARTKIYINTFLMIVFVIYSYSMLSANYYSDKYDS